MGSNTASFVTARADGARDLDAKTTIEFGVEGIEDPGWQFFVRVSDATEYVPATPTPFRAGGDMRGGGANVGYRTFDVPIEQFDSVRIELRQPK